MIIPNKYEDLNKNTLVIGSIVLKKLKDKPSNIEDLYRVIREESAINIDVFFNCITFLWLSEAVELNRYQLSIKKKK